MPEQFSFLFQYLKKLGITIDQDEFIFQVQSHPNYPSLLSISDTLNFLKINNNALSVNNPEELPSQFIALLNNSNDGRFLTYVEKAGSGYKFQRNGKTIAVSKDEFTRVFGNIALIAEKSETQEETTTNKNLWYVPVALIAMLYTYIIFSNGFSFPLLLLLIFVTAGLYLSIQAISGELGISTKFSEAVCGAPSPDSGCNAVVNATKSKIPDFFSFSDISISFFTAQLISILIFSLSGIISDFYNLTLISLLCAVPVTGYSFYLQKFVANKWCPICLSIIAVLYTQLLLLLFIENISFQLNTTSVIYYTLALVASYAAASSIKKLLQTNFDLKSKITDANRFKRNYSFFKMALTANGKINTNTAITAGNIVLGNPNAKLKIIMVTSPYCAYCAGAHKIIEDILELYKERVAVHVRFNVNPIYAEEKGLNVMYKLINIYFNSGQHEFMKAMHAWFINKDEAQLEKYNHQTNPGVNNMQLLLEQYTWNQKNNASFTPIFIINDYFYPTQYGRDELINFINDLEDDESFSE